MFGELVIAYLFLGGMGAGSLAISSLGTLLVPRDEVAVRRSTINGRATRTVLYVPAPYQKLFGPALAVSFITLAIGSIALSVDLGQTNRAELLFLLPQPTFMTLGAYSLALALALCALLAAAWALPHLHLRYWVVRTLAVLAVADGVVVMLYTGLLLSDMQAIPLWNTPWLPPLFVASALSCGSALMLGTSVFTGAIGLFESSIRRLMKLDIVLLVVEAVLAACFIAASWKAPFAVAAVGSASLLHGELAPVFLAGFVGCGIGIPVLAEGYELAARGHYQVASLIASTAVFVGGIALRYSIVMAGIRPEVWI